MPSEYRVLLDVACLSQLPKSGRRRDTVLRFCEDLKHTFHLCGDFQVRDPETQREFEVSLCEQFVVTWWVDAPVKRVVIVDIRKTP